jgi:hypothetical protein
VPIKVNPTLDLENQTQSGQIKPNPAFEIKNRARPPFPISPFGPLGEIRGSKTLEIKVDQSPSKLKTGRDGDTPGADIAKLSAGSTHPALGRADPTLTVKNPT